MLALLFIINCMTAYAAEELRKYMIGDYINHLGTKTPYRTIRQDFSSKPDLQGCEPLKIWMLVRHGTRNPGSAEILQMKERLPELQNLILQKNQEPGDRLDSSALHTLQKWQLEVDATHAKFLVHEGEEEMLELAERFQMRFPTLFPKIYSSTTYHFKYTDSQRTKASADYFVTGLFGRQLLKDIWYPTALPKDPVLRFYKLCNKWKSDVRKNLQSSSERSKFLNSSVLENIIKNLNKELNLDTGSLTSDDVRLIYITCAFETAWNKQEPSPWCAVLDIISIKAMEFLEDLKYYYRDGYGFKITYEQACPAFKDMFEYFDSDESYPKSTVYFTHSGTMLKMLAHLGLYNDSKPLLHTDFAANQHQWRISQIDAFGSNLAFVLNRCGDSKAITVLHQERVVRLPACDSDFCDLETVREYYSNSINCNFDNICNNS